MRFLIRHESLYHYDVPVLLTPHVLRLAPRPGTTRLAGHRITVEPEPFTLQHAIDAFGNAIVWLSFVGSTRRLRVLSELELDTLWPPPLAPVGERLPLARRALPGELAPYFGGPIHPSVAELAAGLAADAGRDPVVFLDRLTRALFERIAGGFRATGEARAAHETLWLGSGACRDLTVLYLDACRSQGLPARFVSGYQALAQTQDGQRQLHAWAEIYLPGAGWRGWDPMHGVRSGDGHVALCAAPEQAATMPIEGGFLFQGQVVNSTLDCSVAIHTS